MKKIVRSLAVASSLATLVACNLESSTPFGESERPATPPATDTGVAAPAANDPMAPAPSPSAGMAIVRVIHASADAPAVDVYAKGSDKPLVTGLAYGQTSGWLEVPPAAYEFELRAAPSRPTDPIAYKTASLTIPAGAKISAVAAGLLGAQDSDSAFRVVPVVEGFGPAVVGSARLRVLHAGSDAPSVDLDVGNDDPTKPEITSLARFADTGAEGVALPAGKALAVGIAAGGARVTAFTTPKLPEGANVLVIATGLLGKLARQRDGFALLAVGPSGSIGFVKQDPRVYALHASPDAPRVDAFVGNAEIVDNLGFGELSKPVQVPPGAYAIDLYAHAGGSARPASEPAATSTTPTLVAGERYLTIATGFLSASGGKPIRLESYREGFALDTGKAQLRAIHSSPDATEVDIGLASTAKIDPVLFAGLAFGKASADEGLGASAGHLPIGITPAGYNATLVARFTLPAASAQRAFVVAAGALAVRPGQSFRLLVVDTAASPWTVGTALAH